MTVSHGEAELFGLSFCAHSPLRGLHNGKLVTSDATRG